MDNIIEQIIAAGIQAPSGENCQPWRFQVRDNLISIFNLPERDNSLYGWGQRASLIAHGALLMNMEIMAKSLGYDVQASLLPNKDDPNHVADVSLEKSTGGMTDLAEQIYKRMTNRKPYEYYTLTSEQREDLLNFQNEARLILVEEQKSIKELGKLCGNNERVLFENQSLHQFFFNHINWDAEEDAKKSIGFYIKTLELPPPVQLGFKLFQHWGIEKILNTLGFPQLIAAGNGKLYGTASAFGAITIDDLNPEKYIQAGKVLQMLWLKLTKYGLVLQPLTGALFLMLKIKSGETGLLSETHQQLVKKVYTRIQEIVGTNQTVAMIFRIGKADPPSAKSSRLKAIISW